MRKTAVLLAALIGLTGACSEVKIRKVRTPTQYDHWDDKDQAEADCMEGFRYYMQRPFVTVYESFPVHARSYLVDGQVSADGRYVRVVAPETPKEASTDPDDLYQVLRTCYRCTDKNPCIPSDAIKTPLAGASAAAGGAPRRPGGQQSALDDAQAQAAVDDVKARAADEAKARAAAPSPTAPPPNVIGGMDQPGSRGVVDLGVTVNSDPYPITPLRKYFDILNLPDFDEQFVVRRTQGLGSASVDLTLGQGNLLQGFASHIDNSSVSNLLFGMLYSAANAFTAAEINPLGLKAMQSGMISNAMMFRKGGQQSTDEEPLMVQYAPVTLRVHVVSYATPGIYPIMKPRECVDWKRACSARDACGGVTSSAPACRDEKGRLVVRVGPYGIPWDTFQYVLVEQADRGAAPTLNAPSAPTTQQTPDKGAIKTAVDAILGDSASYDVLVTLVNGMASVTVLQKVAKADLTDEKRTHWSEQIVAYLEAQRVLLGEIGLPLTSTQMTILELTLNEFASAKELQRRITVSPEVNGSLACVVKKVDSKAPALDLDALMFKLNRQFNKFKGDNQAAGRQLTLTTVGSE